jgi:hypothetical protein
MTPDIFFWSCSSNSTNENSVKGIHPIEYDLEHKITKLGTFVTFGRMSTRS